MNILKYKTKGSSLIEILLYVSFLAVVIVAIGSFVGDVLSAKNKQHAILEVETEVMSMLETMSYDIKRATIVQLPAVSGSGTTLQLTITENGNTFTREYYLLSGIMQQQTGNGANSVVPIQSNRVVVQNVQFTNTSWNVNSNIVSISFLISYNNVSGRKEFDYTRQVTTAINRRTNQ